MENKIRKGIEKALKSNNLTVRPQLDYWASQTIGMPIKVEDRIVGWKLNTDLLGLLFACNLEELKNFPKSNGGNNEN